ncbi:MAG: LemA family protein [Chitinispirillales bacterium]|jgi:LemA protein|nr:LemA family protein [Chitinispirillales bacterium]
MNLTKWIVPAVIVVLIVIAWTQYNGLNRSDLAVDVSWAEIDNQLMRRAELVPDLVRAANRIAAHEAEIINSVTDARARLAGATGREARIQAGVAMEGALSRLLAVMENYPQLRADQGYIRVMDELAGTENRLAVARRNYNTSVGDYNLKLRVVPAAWIARAFGFESRPFFEIPEESRARPVYDL